MSRKLLALNVALAALAATAGLRARSAWLEAQKRAGVIVGLPLRPAPAPPYAPEPAPPPAMAADYIEVAQQMLFSPDRNPNVIVEVTAPKPMPPLPVLYGVMNLGDGMMAIMSSGEERHKEVHPGQKIGEFQLVSVDRERLVLEWEGKQLTKKLSELVAHSESPAAPAPPASGAPPEAPPQRVAAAVANAGPGEDVGGGIRKCVEGDNSPAGTVIDGMKKIMTQTPFGIICRWESIK
jgi:hypothetical protein